MLKGVGWRSFRLGLLGILALSENVGAAAVSPNKIPDCNEENFYDRPHHLGLALVQAERAYFGQECPFASGKICETKQYVIKGDNVVIDKEGAGYTCARFIDPRRGEVSGFLRSAQLRSLDVTHISGGDWIGRWRSVGGEIDVRHMASATLDISGVMLGHELNSSYLDGQGVPKNATLALNGKDDDDAHPTMGGRYTILNLRRYIIVFRDPKLDEAYDGSLGFAGIYVKGGEKLKEDGE